MDVLRDADVQVPARRHGGGALAHMHALLATPTILVAPSMREAWKYGRMDVVRYDPARGAAYYLAKAVADPAADYDVSRRLVWHSASEEAAAQ